MTLSILLPNEEKSSMIYGIEFGCISAVLPKEALGEHLIVKSNVKQTTHQYQCTAVYSGYAEMTS
jgi:hypothetical protein